MTATELLELALAAALLLIVGATVAVHALGLLDDRPMASER